MSQHDFDLTTADANTGPTVRAGMNAMAQALASCGSGGTEPSTTYAYQFWADTTSGYMKQRNAANNAWLTRWQLSAGQLAALSGATFTGLVNLAAGADIASAATIYLTAATGNSPRVTGTTPTSAVIMNTGQIMLVVADGAWPLQYHATTNKLNTGGQDYTCNAGDVIIYHKDLSGVVHGTIFSINGLAVWNNTTDKAIFGYGYTGAFVSMTNLVSNTGVVATDTTGVGTARYALAAAGYGTDKAIFGYGNTGASVSMTNLVSNTGVVATDTTGVGTARNALAAAGYGG